MADEMWLVKSTCNQGRKPTPNMSTILTGHQWKSISTNVHNETTKSVNQHCLLDFWWTNTPQILLMYSCMVTILHKKKGGEFFFLTSAVIHTVHYDHITHALWLRGSCTHDETLAGFQLDTITVPVQRTSWLHKPTETRKMQTNNLNVPCINDWQLFFEIRYAKWKPCMTYKSWKCEITKELREK